MKVLVVYAHPEPRSLNGTLNRFMVDRLSSAGHSVQVSDLYAMNWKAPLDAADYPQREAAAPFDPIAESERGYKLGEQSEDISAEQQKLLWADTVILQFPLWWFTMPAIMKGWVDRVFAHGFAYGVGEHSDRRWGDRYGEGSMAGKRAMLLVTAGGWESHYGPRGINGPIDDLLFPIHHGVLYYPGFDVLPPFVVYRTSKTDADRVAQIRESLGQRLDTLETATPLPFRRQNGGQYEIPTLSLKADVAPGVEGFAAHRVDLVE